MATATKQRFLPKMLGRAGGRPVDRPMGGAVKPPEISPLAGAEGARNPAITPDPELMALLDRPFSPQGFGYPELWQRYGWEPSESGFYEWMNPNRYANLGPGAENLSSYGDWYRTVYRPSSDLGLSEAEMPDPFVWGTMDQAAKNSYLQSIGQYDPTLDPEFMAGLGGNANLQMEQRLEELGGQIGELKESYGGQSDLMPLLVALLSGGQEEEGPSYTYGPVYTGANPWRS